MNILVTAGNTLVPIDRVRCITNIFSGRTGAAIASQAHERGHTVTLLTSHPEAVTQLRQPAPTGDCWKVVRYRSFDDLEALMRSAVRDGPDAVIHCAAVSDYRAAGVYAPAPQTHFEAEGKHWESAAGTLPRLVDMTAGKVKSDAPELWLRLVRTPKLVDFLRTAWGFRGILVKFKLEVGIPDEQLLAIAERSRLHSAADLMVANTLEGAASWAFLGPLRGEYQRVSRAKLPLQLLDAIEGLYRGRHMANVLLGVTGSVAAIRTPGLTQELKRAGYAVRVVATQAALYFFDPAQLDPGHPGRNPAVVILDEDEWPGRSEGRRWQRDDPVVHIELRRWADLLVIAPLDANTLAKLANGLADNCLTCVWRAWDPARPVVLAPAMNTTMWEHPLSLRHLRQLVTVAVPGNLDLDGTIDWINQHCLNLHIAPPQSKRLACGDVGVGGLAELGDIVMAVNQLLQARTADVR